MVKNYDDNYACLFQDGTKLCEEIALRDDNTVRQKFSVKDISFWAGRTNDDGTVTVYRQEGLKLLTKNIKKQHADEATLHTGNVFLNEFNGSGLFLGYQGKTRMEFIPISAACKLSIANRGKISFSGELNDGNFSIHSEDVKKMIFDSDTDKVPAPIDIRLGLAKHIEDSIKGCSRSVQVIIVYGKIIGIMSNRFCPIPQKELTDMVSRVLKTRYPNSYISGGSITNKTTEVYFDLAHVVKENNSDFDILMTLQNSDNGHSAIRLIHECRPVGKNRVYPFYDDDWSSDHIGVTMQDVENGADTMFLKLRNNVALLAEAEARILKHPYIYADKVIDQLNNMARRKGGSKITANMKKDVLNTIDTFTSQGIQTQFTVMEVADAIISSIPTDYAKTSKDALMKNVMRIIHIKHDEYDKI